jgi:hypothetical protein
MADRSLGRQLLSIVSQISGVLFSIFAWIWILGSAVALLTTVSGLLRLPLYTRLRPGIPVPPWALPAYAITFTGFLLSIWGILMDRSWGLSGFVTAALVVTGIQIGSGVSLAESIWILNSATFLIVILGLEEWHPTRESDLLELYRAGLAKEKHSPQKALAIYQHFDDANVTYHVDLLFVGLLGLPLAYLLSYYLNLRLNQFQGVIAIVLMCLLGIGPTVFLSMRRRREKQQLPKRDIWRRQTPPWLSRLGGLLEDTFIWGTMLLMLLFVDVLELATVVLLAAVALLVVMFPYNLWLLIQRGPPLLWGVAALSEPYRTGVSGGVLVVVIIVMLSNVRLKPFALGRILREIPIGLKENSDNIFSFAQTISLWLILLGAATQYGVLYDNLVLGLIVYAFSGALIGWAHYKEAKIPALRRLSVIGQARCLLDLDRTAAARVKIEGLLEHAGSSAHKRSDPFRLMAQTLYVHAKGYPSHVVRQQLQQTAEALDVATSYPELCQENLERLRQALGVSPLLFGSTQRKRR